MKKMKLWNLNNGEEFIFSSSSLDEWLVITQGQCLAVHGDVSYWRSWSSPTDSQVWQVSFIGK